jgi:hypothetical protein
MVTHPRIFREPTPLGVALTFIGEVRDRQNCLHGMPGERHWEIFTRLCRAADAKGNVVPDAYLAALAIEVGAEWVTTDRDYPPVPGPSLATPARLIPRPGLLRHQRGRGG